MSRTNHHTHRSDTNRGSVAKAATRKARRQADRKAVADDCPTCWRSKRVERSQCNECYCEDIPLPWMELVG